MSKSRALGLLSGGLDSILATKLLMEQDIEVHCVNFYTGFCVQAHTGSIRTKEGDPPPKHDALAAAQILGVKLHIVDISEEYVEIVTNPKFGYGKNLNPCMDCKIFMIKKAWELKDKLGFDFIFTGEVVGQRPMSQRKDTMPVVPREAGVEGWLVRPLSAKRLPETEPEKLGLVDREQLLDFHGRTRKPQMALAKKFDLTEYPSPAGGCCFLTDENYSNRLQDLWNTRGEKKYSMDDIILLKAGRHLRLSPTCKMVIGREQAENNFLQGFRMGRILIRAKGIPGPVSLLEGTVSDSEITTACRVAARFGKGKNRESVEMIVEQNGQESIRTVAPMPPEDIPQEWYIA
ncbi:tRNA (5-methylaminomethyl-2-thiouridylate)-methyltransferase [Magnetococcus sp. PR-3]|uniref:tRNA (5-methylaminomethyl-2-thiouridylate)-methyltransferase n=1 Tax=Magnetococcus sp. PR-3 TaxID=3120355 RepID=UPI002FCE0B88